MASPYEVVSFDGTTIDGTTDYVSLFNAGDTWMLTAPVQSQQRRSTSPFVTSTALDGRVLPPLHIHRKNGAAGTVTTHRTVVPKLFDPSKNRAGVRYLVMYWSDGSTVVRVGCHVTQLQTDLDNPNHFIVSLYAPSPYWQANTATVSGTNPATVINAGNAPTYPSVELNGGANPSRRPVTSVGAGAAGGLLSYPHRVALSTTGATTATTSGYVGGVEVPIYLGSPGGAGSYAWIIADTAADGVTATEFDFMYGGARDGNQLGTLDDGGMDWTNSTNTSWVWDEWLISSYPARCGTWRPGKTGNHNAAASISYGISAELATGVTFAIGAAGVYDNAADSMVLTLGCKAGVTNALTNLTRILAGFDGTNAQAFIKFRIAGSANWQYAWTSRTNATVATAVDLDNAVEIAVGVENDGATADPCTLQITNATDPALALLSTPTVTVSAAQTYNLFDGTYTIGETSITFNQFEVRGLLTIDCAARTFTIGSAGPQFGSFSWSHPDLWLEIPGTAAATTVTDGLTVTDTITHRNAYS